MLNNVLSAASSVCAVVGFFVFGLILGTVAVILGLISLSLLQGSQPEPAPALQGSQTNRGSAIAGIIVGVIDIIAALYFLK